MMRGLPFRRFHLGTGVVVISAAVLLAVDWCNEDNLAFLAIVRLGNQPLGFASPGSHTAAVATGTYERSFSFCSQISRTCVVDGDTIRLDGTKIRIADIDTPELSPPRCDYERELGERAKARLRDLLNAGPFTLRKADRDEDRYGRKLRTAHHANGSSIGLTLVDEGLARKWDGARHPWCS